MPWARIDDMLPLHPKVRALTDGAFRLYICAICWSNMNMTDGRIDAVQLRFLSDVRQPKQRADELVRAGLWETADGGWLIHDYLEYQPSAEKVRRERALKAERMERWRSSRDVSTDASRDASRDGAPIPSHPIPPDTSVVSQPQRSNGHRPDLTLVAQQSIAEHAGIDVSPDYAQAVAAQILSLGQNVRNPAHYIKTAIERDPKRFVPAPQPPPVADAIAAALRPDGRHARTETP